LFVAALTQGSNDNFDRSDEVNLYAIPHDADRAAPTRLVAKLTPMQGELRDIRFSPDSSSFVVSRSRQKAPGLVEDPSLWLVKLPDLQLNSVDENHETPVIESAEQIPITSVKDSRFSADGTRLALLTQTDLVLWDLASKKIVWTIPNTSVKQVAYSADGTLIATCGNDRRVQVINTTDGSPRFQSRNHRASIGAIAFSPDGRLLVTGADDGTIKFWHVASGQELMELYLGHAIHQLEFANDGGQLVCQLTSSGSLKPNMVLIFDGSRFDLH
jgi:hypothetical protein